MNYCWYSQSQAHEYGTNIYLIDGKETEVTLTTVETEHGTLWSDIKYIGKGVYVRKGRKGNKTLDFVRNYGGSKEHKLKFYNIPELRERINEVWNRVGRTFYKEAAKTSNLDNVQRGSDSDIKVDEPTIIRHSDTNPS